MRNIIDILNESELICESFKERHIYQAWKTLKDHGMKWSEIFQYGERYKWSEITSDDTQIIDVDDLESEKSNIRKVRSGKDDNKYVIFGFKDEDLRCVYNPAENSIILIGSRSTHWYSKDANGRDHMAQAQQFGYLAECDYLVKVFINKFGVDELRNARNNAQSGRWELTKNDHESKHLKKGELGKSVGGRSDYVNWSSYYYRCQHMAEEAVKRWKEIVAQNKLARETEDNSVNDAVEDILNRLTKFTTQVMKDPKKYDLSTYEVRRIMEKVYDRERLRYGQSKYGHEHEGHYGILYWYNQYCEVVMDLSAGKTTWRSSDELMKARDKYKEIILKQCKEVDDIFKKYGV